MTNETLLQASDLKNAIVYLQSVRDELDIAATQTVIMLVRRKLPALPPQVLTDSLQAVETNLIGQAKTLLDNQIASLQTDFDNL